MGKLILICLFYCFNKNFQAKLAVAAEKASFRFFIKKIQSVQKLKIFCGVNSER